MEHEADPDTATLPLRAEEIRRAEGIGRDVEVLEQTTSTNDLAMARGMEGAPGGLALFAEWQSRGRGRRGDGWHGEPRQDLLFSVLLRPEAPLAHWSRLSHLAALALCRAIEAVRPEIRPSIKWPNDLYLDGRKLAGLLLETRGSGSRDPADAFAVIGIGLNVNRLTFPEGLEVPATSLRLALGRPIDRTPLAGEILGQLEQLYRAGLEAFRAYVPELEARSYLIGRRVTLESAGRTLRGRVLGLGEEGELRLQVPGRSVPLELHSAERIRLEGPNAGS